MSPDPHARVRRSGASACLLFLGLGALYGGMALILAPDGHLLGLPLDGLHAGWWTDFRVPGLLLFSVFGLGSLLSLWALWAQPWPAVRLPLAPHRHWAWSLGGGIGIAQLVWILVQLLLTSFRMPLQAVCAGAGLLLVVLTLWPSRRNDMTG